MIQMNIQKAYEIMEWGAVEGILRELEFPDMFVEWIMLGVTTVSYRYNTCGKQSKILVARRELRQEDPMSPLLFVLTWSICILIGA